MSNPNPSKKWKKGFAPGAGRPKMPKELHFIRELTQDDFRLMIQKIIQARPEELPHMTSNSLETLIASAVDKAIQSGDPSRVQSFFERLWGKVPDKVEYTDTKWVKELPNDQLDELIDELKQGKVPKLLEGKKNGEGS